MLSKTSHIILIVLFSTLSAFGQNNNLVWQKTLGGSGDDYIDDMIEDENGNIYILSTSEANQNFDLLITKTNRYGSTIWNKKIGGSGDENGEFITLNPEGNLTVLASSSSSDDFLPESRGYEDILLLTLNLDGELLTKHNYGGDFIDKPASILYTSDGRTILCGYSRSENGDLTENFGQYDIWVAEIDTDYSIIWQKTYGGNDEDVAVNIAEVENGFVILAQSSSYEGVWNDNRGDIDVVLIKIDNLGNIAWQNSYGGFNADYAADFIVLNSGNILVAANSFSVGNDVTNNNGGSDAWLFEVDELGYIIWNKNYGSYGNESVSALMKAGDRFFLIGTTNSSEIEGSENNGAQDLWLYEIGEETKELLGQNLYGASGFDSGKAIILQADGGVLLGGTTNSNDGVVEGNNGKNDGWILKVGGTSFNDESHFNMYPNPTEDHLYLNQLPSKSIVSIVNQMGQEYRLLENSDAFAAVVDVKDLPSGVYYVTVVGIDFRETQKLVKL